MASSIAIYFDASKCTGCKGCQVACKQWNQLPAPLDLGDAPFSGSFESPLENTADTWLRITFDEIELDSDRVTLAMGRDSCKHCADAPCVSVCAPGACYKANNGTIMLNAEKCIGCQYCVAACPFDIPKLSERDGKVRKCTFCQDRLQNGLTPACRKSCPAMALDFGARSDMIAKAQRRALEIKDRFPHVEVYGVQQMGGLGVISVLPFGSDSHREVSNPQTPLMTQIGNALPAVAGIGVLGALGVTAAALIGGRGSEHTVDQYSYDKVRRVVCDDGVAMDPNAPIVKVGLDRKVVKETKDDLKEGEVKGDD